MDSLPYYLMALFCWAIGFNWIGPFGQQSLDDQHFIMLGFIFLLWADLIWRLERKPKSGKFNDKGLRYRRRWDDK